jgi:hypothetical protein
VPQEAGEGYAIGLLIRDAIEKANSADPKAIRDAIASLDVKTILPGERVAFAANGLNTGIIPILVGWQDGKLKTLSWLALLIMPCRRQTDVFGYRLDKAFENIDCMSAILRCQAKAFMNQLNALSNRAQYYAPSLTCRSPEHESE